LVSEVANLVGRTAKHGYFQAMPFPKVDVQAGHDQLVVVMLLIDELGGQFASVMVVDQRNHGYLLALGFFGFLLDKAVADQVADGLATGGVSLHRVAPVEGIEQRVFERDADACQFRHWTAPPFPELFCPHYTHKKKISRTEKILLDIDVRPGSLM